MKFKIIHLLNAGMSQLYDIRDLPWEKLLYSFSPSDALVCRFLALYAIKAKEVKYVDT